jgi:hypothetical protein
MATPCCPKCSKTRFNRSLDHVLKVTLIYCAACGSVVGALSQTKVGGGTTTTGGNKGSQDNWESQV